MLTSIQAVCFQFHPIIVDTRLPIKKLTTMSKVVPKVNSCLPDDTDMLELSEAASQHKFDISCFCELFPDKDYAAKLAIFESVEEMDNLLDNKDIAIVVG